ncbi:hypothetical protein M409DRAFT_21244 [Zasmidium cellare ATCC 36951]|uniref:Uncharacterized protein n=1 Tax=Zasmidium cellare ATCC 36951 TaxID=1080233 RepID=A0A6A6CMW7_ZASCE|nr:uncharacterized protein M409DRAFT_21244 [Zasmidium cellare ATCC 36951]KAF2168495.1 hypothetical protein M409DRAFT_21244 [Zasmidium cellare ATCC 36951]
MATLPTTRSGSPPALPLSHQSDTRTDEDKARRVQRLAQHITNAHDLDVVISITDHLPFVVSALNVLLRVNASHGFSSNLQNFNFQNSNFQSSNKNDQARKKSKYGETYFARCCNVGSPITKPLLVGHYIERSIRTQEEVDDLWLGVYPSLVPGFEFQHGMSDTGLLTHYRAATVQMIASEVHGMDLDALKDVTRSMTPEAHLQLATNLCKYSAERFCRPHPHIPANELHKDIIGPAYKLYGHETDVLGLEALSTTEIIDLLEQKEATNPIPRQLFKLAGARRLRDMGTVTPNAIRGIVAEFNAAVRKTYWTLVEKFRAQDRQLWYDEVINSEGQLNFLFAKDDLKGCIDRIWSNEALFNEFEIRDLTIHACASSIYHQQLYSPEFMQKAANFST